MFFSHLTLKNFGSFQFYDLSFQPKGLTVLRGPNGAGKTQTKGALLSPLLGRAAVTTNPSGAGPTDVRVSIQEHDNKESLYLSVALDERGNTVLKHGSGSPEAHLRGGPLAGLLRRAISAQQAPNLLLRDGTDLDLPPYIDSKRIERLLPSDMRKAHTWQRFKTNCASLHLSQAGSHLTLAMLLNEFAERYRHGHRLPLIIDEFPQNLLEEDGEFFARILQSIAERSQVILLTHRSWAAAEIELPPPPGDRVPTLTYYNGIADRQPQYQPRVAGGGESRSTQARPIEFDPYPHEEFILDPNEPVVVLLGSVTHEGILSALKSTRRQYKHRMLNSTVQNWWSIVSFFDDYKVSCVVGRVTQEICNLLLREEYARVRSKLLGRLATIPTLIFAHEDLVLGEQRGPLRSGSFPTQDSLTELFGLFRDHGVEITPYARLAEITAIATSFLENTERNLIFRLYVPSGRIWAAEADRFLQLFQDYLSRIDRLSVRLDQKRTDHGTIYEFHGETPAGEKSLTREFHDFSKLMDLCASDATAAADLLADKKLHSQEVARILERYVREARRLQLDIKQEAETRMISLRHRVESELFEQEPTAAEWNIISQLVSAAVPQFGSLLPTPSMSLGIPALPGEGAHVTYNIRPQFIHTVNGIVSEEMSGTQHFDADHRQLLEFIKAHAVENPTDLEAAVHELADKGGKQVDRLKATQKIKAFLLDSSKRLGKEAVSVGFDILQKIIEKKLGV
jgi:hypothetical protein